MKVRSILFIIPYPLGEAPSQRFRFEQYFGVLQSNGIAYKTQSFLTVNNWRLFYGQRQFLQKALALLIGFWRRTAGLLDVLRSDIVFIHREASPIGPPIFEWIIANVLRRRIVYDFDDAIWLTDRAQEAWITRALKWRGKISTICKMAYKVSCGNAYLANFAGEFNQRVFINPTTIDTETLHNPDLLPATDTHPHLITIGWTGSHSTLKYLEEIEYVLQRIEIVYPYLNFIIIADRAPKVKLNQLTFIPWSEKTEVEDLRKIDIGLMPLPDDEWSKGKCGFKILQYMSLKIPSVSSAVGANKQIVQHGENGLLSFTTEDWFQNISELIEKPALRQRLGNAGRDTVIKRYSVNSNTATFLALFE